MKRPENNHTLWQTQIYKYRPYWTLCLLGKIFSSQHFEIFSSFVLFHFILFLYFFILLFIYFYLFILFYFFFIYLFILFYFFAGNRIWHFIQIVSNRMSNSVFWKKIRKCHQCVLCWISQDIGKKLSTYLDRHASENSVDPNLTPHLAVRH